MIKIIFLKLHRAILNINILNINDSIYENSVIFINLILLFEQFYYSIMWDYIGNCNM